MKFRKLENPMETININGFEIEPDEVFEVYDHSIDTIDPDEPEIPGPDPETYGYNDPVTTDLPGFEGTMEALEDLVDGVVGEPEFLGGR
tara:strand:+ start:252 stop:518 length:267 start_codon:yes stop_codon:yes gene_type:complete